MPTRTIKDRPEEMPSDQIDRGSFEPAYAQLANLLRRQIATGVYGPEDKLPPESVLCKKYKVSSMTVRRAINILSDQGVVDTVQGLGTFVKPLNLGSTAFRLDDVLFSDPDRVRIQLLSVRIVRANERISGKLLLQDGEKTMHLRRLLFLDEEPAYYHQEYMIYDPALPIVESEMEVTSLQGLFQGVGNKLIRRGEMSVDAVLMSEEESRLLETDHPAAALSLEHIFYDFNENPISWGWFICRGDRLNLTAGVGYDQAK